MRFTRVLFLIIVMTFIFVWFHFDLSKYLDLTHLKEYYDIFSSYYADHPLKFLLLYFLAVMLLTTLALPVAGASSILGGAIFGPLLSCIFITIAMTTGGFLSFLITRLVFKNMVDQYFHKRIMALNHHIKVDGIYYMFFIRLSGLFPYFIINLLLAVTSLSKRHFIWGTIIGVIPSIFIFSFIGQQLTMITSMQDLISIRIILIFFLLGILALIPVIIKHYKNRFLSLNED